MTNAESSSSLLEPVVTGTAADSLIEAASAAAPETEGGIEETTVETSNKAAELAAEKAAARTAEAAEKDAAAAKAFANLANLNDTVAQVAEIKATKLQCLEDLCLARETRLNEKAGLTLVADTIDAIEATKTQLAEARSVVDTIPELEAKLAELEAKLASVTPTEKEEKKEEEVEDKLADVSVLSEENLAIAAAAFEAVDGVDGTPSEHTAETASVGSSIMDERFDAARVFAIFDADSSNFIDKAELTLALTAVSETPVTEEIVTDILNKFDLDGDGSISFEEFKKLAADPMFAKAKKSKKLRALKMFSKSASKPAKPLTLTEEQEMIVTDIKQDLVEREQIKALEKEVEVATEATVEQSAALEAATKAAEELQAEADMAKADAERQTRIAEAIEAGEWSAERVFAAYDADNSGTLDEEELSLALTCLCGNAVSASRAKKLLAKFDTNDDGVLDFAEFENVAAAAQKHVGSFLKKVFGDSKNLVEAEETRAKVAQLENGEITKEVAFPKAAAVAEEAEADVTTESKNYVPFVKRPTGLSFELGEKEEIKAEGVGEDERVEEVAAQ
jgi:Ca2+-binding EF-hand superfamily protein